MTFLFPPPSPTESTRVYHARLEAHIQSIVEAELSIVNIGAGSKQAYELLEAAQRAALKVLGREKWDELPDNADETFLIGAETFNSRTEFSPQETANLITRTAEHCAFVIGNYCHKLIIAVEAAHRVSDDLVRYKNLGGELKKLLRTSDKKEFASTFRRLNREQVRRMCVVASRIGVVEKAKRECDKARELRLLVDSPERDNITRRFLRLRPIVQDMIKEITVNWAYERGTLILEEGSTEGHLSSSPPDHGIFQSYLRVWTACSLSWHGKRLLEALHILTGCLDREYNGNPHRCKACVNNGGKDTNGEPCGWQGTWWRSLT